MRWCPTCRLPFPGDGPPFAVTCINTDPPTHVVPVTREPTEPVLDIPQVAVRRA